MVQAHVSTYSEFVSVVTTLRRRGEVFYTSGQSTDELVFVPNDSDFAVNLTVDAPAPATILGDFPDAIQVSDLAFV